MGVWSSWYPSRYSIHIRFQLEHPKITCSPEIRKAWRYIFEAWRTQENNVNHEWHELKASISLDGWTNAAVRQLALIHRPYLTVERDSSRPKPPENREHLRVRDIVHLDVKYPKSKGLRPPDKYIATAVREFRKNLDHAVYLETELGGYGLGILVPIEPDPDLRNVIRANTGDLGCGFILCQAFQRTIDKNPKHARQEYLSWRIDDETVFARLRIWACGDKRVVSAIEAGEVICSLTDRVFWEGRHQRDLLLVWRDAGRIFPAGKNRTREKVTEWTSSMGRRRRRWLY